MRQSYRIVELYFFKQKSDRPSRGGQHEHCLRPDDAFARAHVQLLFVAPHGDQPQVRHVPDEVGAVGQFHQGQKTRVIAVGDLTHFADAGNRSCRGRKTGTGAVVVLAGAHRRAEQDLRGG